MTANTLVPLYLLFATSLAMQTIYLHTFNYGILFNKQFETVNSMSKWEHTFVIPLKEFEVPFNITFPDLCIGKLAQRYKSQCSFYWEVLHSMNIFDKDLASQLKGNVNIIKHLVKSQKKNRNPRALDFLGDGLEYLFGTVSAKTLRQVVTQMETNVERYVSNVENNVISLTDALASHQVVIDQKLTNFDRAFELVNSMLNDSMHMIRMLKRRLNDQSSTINNLTLSVNEHNYMQKYLLVRQVSVNNYALLNQIQTTKQMLALSCLMQNRLPTNIITPNILTQTLEHVKSELENKYQTFSLLHNDINFYYKQNNIQSYITKNFLYIHFDIPITDMNTVFTVYSLHSLKCTHKTFWYESGLSKIENTSPFIAVSQRGKHYFHMTEHDVLGCSKTQIINECDKTVSYLPQRSRILYFIPVL